MSKFGPRDRCGLCGESSHPVDSCDMVPLGPIVPDKPLPPRALLTLPDGLTVEALSDQTSYLVRAVRPFVKGTRFGPVEAPKTGSLLPSVEFPLKVFEETVESFLDTSDENECNWLMYVPVARNLEEQNLICYQHDSEIYFVATRDLNEGDRLTVWYSPRYAAMMNKRLLNRTVEETVDSVPTVEASAATVDELVQKRITARSAWCCKFCGRAESKVTEFARHLAQHYETKLRRVCETCSGAFSSRKALQKHVRIVHAAPSATVPVGPCQATAPVGPSPAHPAAATSDPLLVQTVSSSDNNPCLVPVEQTGLLGCMDNYDSSELNVDSILADKDLDHFNFDLNDSESEKLICDVCLKTFQKLKQLVLHLAQHTGRYACLECNKVFTRKENFDHHSCRAFYKLKCPECDRLFLQSKHLRSHVDFVHRKKYSCESCGARMRCAKTLEEHACVRAAPIALVACGECPKTFTTRANQRRHAKIRHGGCAETVTCPICAKRFADLRSYRRHERTAHGEKGHECPECGARFARRDVLGEHVAARHGKGEVVCAVCSKTFSTGRLLRRHMLTHSDLKPHRCPVCPSSFRTGSNLLRHSRSAHSGSSVPPDRPFGCLRCPSRFKAKRSLARHSRKAHPTSDEATAKAAPPVVDDELESELRRTMERIDFDAESDIQVEIDKLLNESGNFDSLLSESNDRLVESLLEIAGTAQALSMPDLDAPS